VPKRVQKHHESGNNHPFLKHEPKDGECAQQRSENDDIVLAPEPGKRPIKKHLLEVK
jgi:hypothetical protein